MRDTQATITNKKPGTLLQIIATKKNYVNAIWVLHWKMGAEKVKPK